MMRLTADHLHTLERLSKSPDVKFVVDIMKFELADWDAKLRVLTGDELLRAQGHAQTLAEWIKRLDPAKPPARPTVSPFRA